MAMENKRIIQLNTERTTPAADDYVMVDSATAGTAKYLLPKITDAIDQEISDRTSADTALQTAITNETTARANADTTLQGNITAEATARAEADTAINGEITQLKEDLSSEIVLPQSPNTIVQGSFNSTGAVVVNSARIRISDFVKVQSGSRIKFTAGTNTTQMLIGYFNTSKVYQRDSQWYSDGSVVNITEDGYLIIIFRKDTSNTAITPEEYDATTVLVPTLAGKFEDLQADLNNKANSYTEIDDTVLNSRVNYPNGNIVSSNNTRRTDYVPCKSGTKIEWKGWSFYYQGSAAMYCVAFYNASKQFISGVTQVDGISATTSQEGTITTVAPQNAAYVIGCTNHPTAPLYLHVYDINLGTIKAESHESYLNLPISKQVIQSPPLSNGSGGNPDNTNGVTARSVLFYGASSIVIKNNRSVSESGNYYKYDISAFKGSAWYSNRITGILADDNEEFTFDCSTVINGVAGVTGFGVTIWEYNSSDVLQTLRTGDFVNGDLIVRYTYSENVQTFREVNNDEVKHKLLNARHQKNSVGTPLTILHFSDLHADTSALKRILADAANTYKGIINDKICTGDMVSNTYEQISSWWASDVLTCMGNHDTASYTDGQYNWTALSMADRDAYYIAPFESNWGIVHTSGTSYYYKDYSTQKVRMIVLDGMLYTNAGAEATAQTAWLTDLLSDAITNSFHVVIAIHAPHGGATAEECSFSKYNQEVMPTYSDCNTPQVVIDTVATAITNGLHFIGYIVGHTHQDNIWDAEDDGKQLMFCVTCANQNSVAQWRISDQDRSNSIDAYNLATIDTTNTLVKIIRGGGADIDDHMRTRKAICFNYSTGEKVGEVL